MKTLVTLAPYAPFIDEVLRHPFVSGMRLNTVMPIKGNLEDTLKGLLEKAERRGKEFWVDLKCRQLRVASYSTPPFTEIALSHEIEVETPAKAYFSDRNESATILAVEGNRLIMQEGPKRVVGPGESVTIPHVSIRGYFTDSDKRYMEACEKLGIHTYMLSFVEQQADIDSILSHDPKANVIAKIESEKGLKYVEECYDEKTRLMAARGDLYMELHWPHKMIDAVQDILAKDPDAIVASRILDSFALQPEPSCQDVGDLDNLLRMGYRNFMLGDEVCLRRETIVPALNVLQLVAERYK